jgi:hypothetical protein
MGTSFVASHVWRELVPSGQASRERATYSFVPNLVWLPAQVSKLSDREGSFVQTYLQALSWKIWSYPVSVDRVSTRPGQLQVLVCAPFRPRHKNPTQDGR